MADISSIQLPSGNTYDIKDSTARSAIPTKVSQLTNDSEFITGMTILSYGSSTWDDFIEAYNANKVVYCRASSNANPASGSQTRLAFMAYVNNATTPTNVEFQYYRSVSSHTASQQGDQVFVYKLDKKSGWSVTTREASVKVVAGDGLGGTYSNGTMTLTGPTKVSDLTNDSGFIDDLTDLGITVTATELNYTDGVTSNIQTQIDGKYAWFDGSSYTTVVALCNAMAAKPKSIYLKQAWSAQILSDCPAASVAGNAKLTVINGSNTSASAPNYMALMYEVTNGTIHEMWRGATYGSSADTRSVKWFKLSTSYCSGDVVNIGACVFAGYFDASKNLYFHIPLNKDLSNVSSASISTDTSWAIFCAGSILLSNTTLASFGTITCTKTDTGVLVKVAPSSTGNITARETVSVRANTARITLT